MKKLFVLVLFFRGEQKVIGVYRALESVRKAVIAELMAITGESREQVNQDFGYDIDFHYYAEVGDYYFTIHQTTLKD